MRRSEEREAAREAAISEVKRAAEELVAFARAKGLNVTVEQRLTFPREPGSPLPVIVSVWPFKKP